MSFSLQIAAFANKAKDNAELVVKKVVFEVQKELVLKSPVGDAKYWKHKPPKGYVGGRFRANWQYGSGTANTVTTSEIDSGSIGSGGTKTINRLNAAVGDKAGGKVHYITNSLPYAQRLEDGWSRQSPPYAMVYLTVLDWQIFINKAIAELSV